MLKQVVSEVKKILLGYPSDNVSLVESGRVALQALD
jgi:hypothetical protein